MARIVLHFLAIAALLTTPLAAAPVKSTGSPQTKSTRLPSGVIKEVWQIRGSVTGHRVTYTAHFPPGRSALPILFHHYGKGGKAVDATNARIATYDIFCVSIGLSDSHCGYELQDYKDAMDDVYARYAEQIDTSNVTIMGVSYGGAVTFGMAVRFPYRFDAAVPVFGVSDFGYDDSASWWVMIERNSPEWGPYAVGMPKNIGERAEFRDTRYLVRNAIFAAVNNPYTHFEILHDSKDGVGRPGVHVENSRRFVAELNRLGYSNYRYTETPREGFIYPEDERLPRSCWGKPVRYTHSFFQKRHRALYHFELYTLKDSILNRRWKRPPFEQTGRVFVPTFLETPYFRFDLGHPGGNCDEAADVGYDVRGSAGYRFEVVPRTRVTQVRLRVLGLKPGRAYALKRTSQKQVSDTQRGKSSDERGVIDCQFAGADIGEKFVIECEALAPVE